MVALSPPLMRRTALDAPEHLKPTWTITIDGERIAEHLITDDIKQKAIAKHEKLGKKKTKDITCPEDVAPYAAIVCERFYGTPYWADMLDSDKRFVIKQVNILRKKYSVDDIDYTVNVWMNEPEQKTWAKSATLGSLTNGKGHIAKALAERDNKHQSIEYELTNPDELGSDDD
jgi:hypothetical protein